MKKRILAVLLTVAMVVSAGCSSGSSTSTSEAQNSNTEAESEKVESGEVDKKEVTKLSMMAIGEADNPTREELVAEIIEKFNSENEYNVEIELELLENEQYKTKFATLMTQNNMSDIFFTWEYGYLEPYVEAGKVMDLTEALDADPEWKDRFSEGIFGPLTYDGHIYAVPSGRKLGPIYYNKEIFEECGVSVPATWDEFLDVISKIKEKGYVPISMATSDAWIIAEFFLDIIGGVGGLELYNGIYTGDVTWTDPQFIQAGGLLQDLVAAGAFPENFSGLSYDEGTSMFTSGKAAMYPMGTWVTAAIVSGMDANNVGVFLPPAYNAANNKAHMSQVDMSWGISESCENKEAALAFLKMFSDAEYQERFLLEAGMLPATDLEVDTAKVDPITASVIDLAAGGIDQMAPFDVLLGANVGVEFNNISLAIATGKDPADQFAQLQAYAESVQE